MKTLHREILTALRSRNDQTWKDLATKVSGNRQDIITALISLRGTGCVSRDDSNAAEVSYVGTAKWSITTPGRILLLAEEEPEKV